MRRCPAAIHESFVDARIKDVDSSEFKAPAVPHPVQLIYEFQTKDVANAKATEATKDAVYAQVAKSPLFSSVSDKPVEGGALLIIRVNNKSATDQHEVGKGLLTGLTWGLAGNVVEDHYFGSARYLPAGNTTPIEVRDEHAIYSTIGLEGAPPNVVHAPSLKDAVMTMLHQLVSHLLNDLSHDPNFQ